VAKVQPMSEETLVPDAASRGQIEAKGRARSALLVSSSGQRLRAGAVIPPDARAEVLGWVDLATCAAVRGE